MHSQVAIPQARVEEFCRRNGIKRLALFGSVLRDDFASESDVDVLVEFLPGVRTGYRFFRMQEELANILGRKVDLNTPECLSKYFRDEVLAQAEVIHDEA